MRAEHTAQVHHLKHVEAQIAQIILHRRSELRGRHRGQPVAFIVAASADFGDDAQIGGIGMQRLANELISHVWTVKIGGINMIDARLDRFLQYADRGLRIFWRAKDAGPRKLHCPVSQTINQTIA